MAAAANNKNPTIPTDLYAMELVPGGVKAVKSSARRSDSMYFIEPAKLRVLRDYNVRIRTPDYLAYVRQLADDMKANGFNIDKPVTAFIAREGEEDVIYLQAGHTRTEAALLAISEGADFTEIPFIIKPKSTDAVDMTVDLIRSNDGRHLSAMEKAVVVRRLEHHGLSEAEIARRVQLNASYVNGLLLLAGAPSSIKDMVVNEQVSASTAISMMRKHGSHAIEMLQKLLAVAEGKADGGKVKPSALPGVRFDRAVKKSAPKLFEAATRIKLDPAFDSLGDDTRKLLDELLSQLEEARKEAEA